MVPARAIPALAFLLLGAPRQSGAQRVQERTATVQTNGVRLFYRISGSGPAILLVHGSGLTGTWWDSLVPALSLEHTVLVPDLRGHGRSTNPSGRYSHALLADDLIGLLDSLHAEKIHAIGHSSGAAALLHLAMRAPGRIERMVLIGMGARLTERQRDAFMKYPSLDKLSPFVRAYLEREHARGPTQINEILAYVRAIGADTSEINFDMAKLSTIFAATLIIVGDRDGHTVENAALLYRAMPNSRFWVIPGQGHYPFWPAWGGDSTMARAFPSVVLQFLRAK